MKRWAERWPHLKWLLPGMGVKRWILLLIVGLLLLGLGIAALANYAAGTGWVHWANPGSVSIRIPLLAMLLLLAGGSVTIILAVYGFSRSLLSAFRRPAVGDVVDIVYRHRQRQRGPKVVAIGGGHGLNTLLRGLKEYSDHLTAILTVADDGGSSGRLRRDLGILPPGDFRNCIAALSDDEGLMAQLFQYRFGEETDLEGHSFGNLYLTAMAAITGSFELALAESSRILAVRGRVIPSSLAQVTLCAEVFVPAAAVTVPGGNGRDPEPEGLWLRVQGESAIPQAQGRIQRVYLEPEEAPAYPEAIRAILEADLIVAGPGSLYTSVLPNLLVRDLAAAIRSSRATKVYVCNVATQGGETDHFDVTEHVRVLQRHVGNDLFDIVLANHTFRSDRPPGGGADFVRLPAPDTVDYRLVTRDLVDSQYPWRHDAHKLARAIVEFVKS